MTEPTMPLPAIPQDPYEGATWKGSAPFPASPAEAYAMVRSGRPQASRWSVLDYMLTYGGKNNPYYVMQKYFPAAAEQVDALRGLGADPASGLLGAVNVAFAGGILVALGMSAVAGYYAGKALSPTGDLAKNYGIAGAAVGILSSMLPYPVTVPAGLGAMAYVVAGSREER